MPVDRYALLEWLAQWENDHPGQNLDGMAVLTTAGGLAGDDPRPWAAVASACAALRRQDWIEWRYLLHPGEDREPLPQFIDEMRLQQVHDIVVSSGGHAVLAAREKHASGSQVNIVNSVVGQLALGNISNLDIAMLLDAAEQSLDAVEASVEVKAESRRIIQRMREAAQSIGSLAVQETLAAALRHALGLP